ncbi:UvrD-helicase domain-containing protein [Winogradskyella wichelsiae]|uniref:UvrD-helicase domain-containing protein n=1 Tax=Winogradskyella wichelsiae TaxID=2697007 RepID=UPI003EF77C30
MLEGLNEQQLDAVTTEGNVLLTACPGSGKTRALTYKIAYELNRLDSSKKTIVAVTFTNRAADEIKKRLHTLNTDDSSLWAGTIHAFCLEWIIRPYMCYLVELKDGFSISDEYHSRNILDELKDVDGIAFWQEIITRYNLDGTIQETAYPHIVQEYHRILASEKMIDFDQILHYAYQLISRYPKIGETLKNLFHLICVDEYQDTQNLQYAILAEIMKAKTGQCTVFIVGDSDQAIYGSLGGVAKSLSEINTQFGNIGLINKELSGNYRSNQEIIDYYVNFQSSGIEIEALGRNAHDTAYINYDDVTHKDDLPQQIANIIQSKLDEGIAENEICVLAPTWFLVIPLGRKLKSLLPNINFDAVGLSPLLKNKENIWFKVARLFLVEPSPNYYSTRKRWATELIQEFEEYNFDILSNEIFKSKKILKIINSISSNEDNGLDYLNDVFNQFMIKLDLKLDIHKNLAQLHETFFEGARKRLSNEDFDLARDIGSFKRMFKSQSGIVVNTCHGIKGEEFDTVICTGLLHGRLPNWNEEDKIEAANKLLYVICSRAKRQLYLMSETGRRTNSGNPYNPTYQLTQLLYDYD